MKLNYKGSTLYSNKRIIFAGGTDWSVEFLQTLVKQGFNVVGVLAPPDSKKDRGQKVSIHILKKEAEKLKIPVWQPEKISDKRFLAKFRQVSPDVAIVVAYGKLFTKEILAIPLLGFINFHPSLLPKLRGPSPIASAILEGFKETGISIMKLQEGMDDGPILAQKKIEIDRRETSVTLTRKLVDLGIIMLPNILKKYLVGTQHAVFLRQDDSKATCCKIIKKDDGRVNWQNETASQIDRKVRALNPNFKTFTFLDNKQKKRVNILETAGISTARILPGQYELIDNSLAVGTKQDVLLISKIQLEGKRPINAKEFFQGYREGHFLP